MRPTTSRDQSLQVLATLAVNTDWDEIDFRELNLQDQIVRDPKGFGKQFTAFLKNGGYVENMILEVNRSKRYKPIPFFNTDYTVWKGPADGDGLHGKKEEDERSLALTKLDFRKIRFETGLGVGETEITGEDALRRLKGSGLVNNFILLDGFFINIFLDNERFITKKLEEQDFDCVAFPGTVYRDQHGNRRLYALSLRDGKKVEYSNAWLESTVRFKLAYAVLES